MMMKSEWQAAGTAQDDFDAHVRSLTVDQRVFAPLFVERIHRDRDRRFLTMGERSYTFGEIGALSIAFARGLATLGIGVGSVVPIMLPNCPEFIVAWFALHLRGATMALVNPDLKGRLLENALDDCRPTLVIAGSAQVEQLAQVDARYLEGIAAVVAIEPPSSPAPAIRRVIQYADVMRHDGADPVVPTSFDQVQSIFFTSGSSGPPKGVLMPNGHFFANALTFLRLSDLQRDDVLHTSLPLFHGIASRQGVLPAFMIGAQVHLGSKFSASRFWQTVTEAGATIALLTPTMTPVLNALPAGPFDRQHRLRALYNVPHDASFEARFNVRMLSAFAITEIGVVIYTPYSERRFGSVGVAHPDWELAIVDEMGRQLGDGEAGELVCRPRRPYIVMQGYLNRAAATVSTWENLWYHTGDIMRRDTDGYYTFVDRNRDRIRRRGENISPSEIEREVRAHPAVRDCVVTGHAAPLGEDDIRLVVVGDVLLTLPAPAELANWLRQRLPASMVPRYIEYADELPLTPTGKVDRNAIRQAIMGAGAWDAERC